MFLIKKCYLIKMTTTQNDFYGLNSKFTISYQLPKPNYQQTITLLLLL